MVRPPVNRSSLIRWLGHPAWVWMLLTLPLLIPLGRWLSGDPTMLADPLEGLLHFSGLMAIACLSAVLSLTPLRVLFPSPWTRALNRHRKLIGNAAWVWATFHLLVYVAFAGGWLGLQENIDRPFILAGLAAWFILSILAFTSWRRIMRALGSRNWKRLHRMVYLAVALAFFHYLDQEKTGWGMAPWFFVPLILLQAGRLFRFAIDRLRSANFV